MIHNTPIPSHPTPSPRVPNCFQSWSTTLPLHHTLLLSPHPPPHLSNSISPNSIPIYHHDLHRFHLSAMSRCRSSPNLILAIIANLKNCDPSVSSPGTCVTPLSAPLKTHTFIVGPLNGQYTHSKRFYEAKHGTSIFHPPSMFNFVSSLKTSRRTILGFSHGDCSDSNDN